jgi:hypothetical protein
MVYLRRKSECTAMSWKCTAMLAGKVNLSRKTQYTAIPYFCQGGKIPTSLALAARESGLSGNRPRGANTPGGLQFPYPSKDRRRKGTIN